MTTLNIPAETDVLINLAGDAVDSGWEISNQYAIHYPCNPGYIIKNALLEVGKTYSLTYEVSNYVSGSVKSMIGTSEGTSRTANGTFTDIITATDNGVLQFYSDGFLRLKTLKYYDINEVEPGVTISYHEDEKHWGCDYSFHPDMMMKFINMFLSFKNGALWMHNTNAVRNNFYGVQYSSQIQFYVNMQPTAVKNFYSMRVQSNKPWGAVNTGDIYIRPIEGKSNGQSSRLKSGNFKNYQGNYFADFLRDATDPRFNDELTALMKGALLQGQVMEITLTNNDTTEVRLLDVDVTISGQNYSY